MRERERIKKREREVDRERLTGIDSNKSDQTDVQMH